MSYQDASLPIGERVEDLLGRMTTEEKAGLLFQTMIGIGPDGSLVEEGSPMGLEATGSMVSGKLMNHFNLLGAADPRLMAEWHNRLQALAEQTRLGIPVTVSTDPRHGFVHNPATSAEAKGFSQWPEPPGLAAARDPELVRLHADIARREYLAVGIRVALGPMADLSTEPRWARNIGTFGEDAELSSRLVAAYIQGMQGEDGIGPDSVACMTKHFPGAGPQLNGEDAHFHYGREQVYPGGNFDYHLKPFEAAFAAGTSQIMPYYAMPVGLELEEVGFGFNQGVIEGMLRGTYGFDGIVCTDWGLVTDSEMFGYPFPARAWGVEGLDELGRVEKILNAGCDQLGGEARPELVVRLVESGRIAETRIDMSVRRLLREKFRLGLFDDRRYVDPDAAEELVGNPEFTAAGFEAQRRSIVVLKDLPSFAGKLYVEGIDTAVAQRYGTVVDDPKDADLAVLRIDAPWEPRPGGFEQYFRQGRLDFTPDERDRILTLLKTVPTIVDVFLDRPAVLPEIAGASAGLIADFGASDEAVLDVVSGAFRSSARLPFELPRSMAQVEAGREDVPRDSGDPLYPFGHGL